MKEATGELNMTVITVVAIAAVAAMFYAFLWPNIKTSIQAQTICSNGPNYLVGTARTEGYVNCGALGTDNKYTCSYYMDGKAKSITCTQK